MKNASSRKNTLASSQSYVYGNTAPKTRTQPQQRSVRKHKQTIRKKNNRISAANRNRARLLAVSPLHAFFLIAMCVMVLLACIQYLKMQSCCYQRQQRIIQLQSQIRTFEDRNDALDYSISGYINKKHVIKIATKELGMIKATKKQVKLYTASESEYMKQWQDFPQGD